MNSYQMQIRYVYLKITGDIVQLNKLREAAKGTTYDYDDKRKVQIPFSLQALFPPPPELVIAGKECGNDLEIQNKTNFGFNNVFDWRCWNWGTGEDVLSCEDNFTSDNSWDVNFVTWLSFPIDALIKISLDYHLLTLKYQLGFYELLDYGTGKVANGKDYWDGWWPNKEGYFDDGLNIKGFDKTGTHENGTMFDDKGLDQNGFDQEGFDQGGFDSSGIHRETGQILDNDGFDQNLSGVNGRGFNCRGIHVTTRTKYDQHGFDHLRYDYNGNQEDDPF